LPTPISGYRPASRQAAITPRASRARRFGAVGGAPGNAPLTTAPQLGNTGHVVIQTQENRSFDHYFGTLAGVTGFGDPNVLTQSDGKSLFYQPDPQNPDGVGRTPWNTAFTADSATAYVTNANDDTVTVIDAATRRVTTTIALGGSNGQLHHQPTAIGLSPAGNIWATCNSSSSLAVIDTSSNTVIASTDLGLGDDPTGIAFA